MANEKITNAALTNSTAVNIVPAIKLTPVTSNITSPHAIAEFSTIALQKTVAANGPASPGNSRHSLPKNSTISNLKVAYSQRVNSILSPVIPNQQNIQNAVEQNISSSTIQAKSPYTNISKNTYNKVTPPNQSTKK